MVRALRLSVLLALVLALIPSPAGAADLGVSFEVVRVTPVSATIRATITGATEPLQVTARVDPYRGEKAPVQGLQVNAVERIAEYRDTPQYETVRTPINEKIATLEAEVAALVEAPIVKGEDTTLKEEVIDGKEDELAAFRAQADLGATICETQEVVAHRYDVRYRERLVPVAAIAEHTQTVLAGQSWAEPPPQSLVSEQDLKLAETTVNWGEGTRTYEYTIQTDSLSGRTSGILVLTINGRDYYDDTNSSWWDEEWPYRMKLTIDNSASTEDLIDFPLMVKLTPERFDYAFCQTDGDDVRFVDSDGTALDYECDTWTLDGDSWFWVRVPQIDAGSDTDYIWMYWGTPTVANGENAEGVWPTDIWAAVYHMNDDDAGTGILDSTANGFTGTKTNAASIMEAVGSVGKCQTFNGDGSYVTATLAPMGTSDYTVLALTRSPAWVERNAMFFSGAGGTTAKGLFALILQQYSVYGYLCDGSATRIQFASRNFNTTYHNNTWATFALTLDRDVAARHYQNGAQLGADDASITAQQGDINVNSANPPRIGVRVSGVNTTHDIDELRISSEALGAEWIEADHLNMTDSLLTYGDAEGPVIPAETEPAVALPMALLCVGVAISAVRQRHIILYLAAFILLLFLGFATFDASLPMAIMAFTYAGYMLYSMSTWFWSTR